MQYEDWTYSGPVKFNLIESRPPEENCQTDGVSSDVTVRCQDSDAEEEFIGVEEQIGRASRLRTNHYNTSQSIGRNYHHLPVAMHQGQLRHERIPSDTFQMDPYRTRRTQTLSWGFQQEMAEYEASLKYQGRPHWERPPPPPPPPPPPAPCPQFQQCHPILQQQNNTLQLQQQQQNSKRRVKGNRKSQGKQMLIDEIPPPPPPPPVEREERNLQNDSGTQTTKSRRRGRRGGRGRRHKNERPADEVPKLEKSFEDELAQQMADHISNKSALTHSFSSLRLRVAGGGTMIILNNKEILNGSQKSDLEATPTGVNEYTKDKLTPSPNCDPTSLQGNKSNKEHPGHKVSRPKGCGAFFPPQVLQQMQGRGGGGEDPRSFDNLTGIVTFNGLESVVSFQSHQQNKLNVYEEEEEEEEDDSQNSPTSTTIAPVSDSPVSALNKEEEEEVQTFQDITKEMGVAGTGCFLPSYLQEQQEFDHDFQNSTQGLDFSPQGRLQDQGIEIKDNPVLADSIEEEEEEDDDDDDWKKDKKLIVGESKNKMDPNSMSGDLLEMVESHDFTTYTSPLHFEEALVGLKADRTAREETEQKLINLQLENEELKSSVNETSKLSSQIESLETLNHALLTVLCMERSKHQKRTWYKDFTPNGLSSNNSFSIPTLPKKPMIDEEVQVDEKKTSSGKLTGSISLPSSKGHTRSISSVLGDSKNVGKESSKLEKRNLGSTSIVKRTTGGQVEKVKDSKQQQQQQQNENSGSDKGKQDELQMKGRRQLGSTATTVSSVGGASLANKKAPQNNPNRIGDAQIESTGKKKKVGLNSKTKVLSKKTSISSRCASHT
eukprot:g2103.t1